jgi:ribonucleoside-diphosphate reductase alpha chain
MIPDAEGEEVSGIAQDNMARLAEQVARRLSQISNPSGGLGMGIAGVGGGIAPDPQGVSSIAASSTQVPSLADRGIYHAADAMRDMFEMGDAPSCSVCGAIMVRNGSCYRCMECGSTSGCS